MEEQRDTNEGTNNDFEKEASEGSQGLISEFLFFIKTNNKWWLTPIIIMLLAVSGFVVAAATPWIAPFIYTLF